MNEIVKSQTSSTTAVITESNSTQGKFYVSIGGEGNGYDGYANTIEEAREIAVNLIADWDGFEAEPTETTRQITPITIGLVAELELDFRTYNDNPDNPYTPIGLAHWESSGTIEIGGCVYQFMFSENACCVYENRWQDGKLILLERVEIEGYIPSQLESKIASFKEAKSHGFRIPTPMSPGDWQDLNTYTPADGYQVDETTHVLSSTEGKTTQAVSKGYEEEDEE